MDTRDRLVESMQALLWERGYVGTSPRAVQERSGAGQGSMYHHFTGKPDLALAALRRSGGQLREQAEAALSGPGSALERITAYLRRERDALRGCPIGRMAQDPDIVASKPLRQPVHEMFMWLKGRLAGIVREGQEAGEFGPQLDPEAVAAAIAAVLQGGYVLARAANGAEPFRQAIDGALQLLTGAQERARTKRRT